MTEKPPVAAPRKGTLKRQVYDRMVNLRADIHTIRADGGWKGAQTLGQFGRRAACTGLITAGTTSISRIPHGEPGCTCAPGAWSIGHGRIGPSVRLRRRRLPCA